MTSQQLTAALTVLFPGCKFTDGYIGNCGAGFDHRSFKIFSNVIINDGWGSAQFSIPIEDPNAVTAEEISHGLLLLCKALGRRLSPSDSALLRVANPYRSQR